MEHLELLQEIIAHPEDDNLRLIYADWLEERGDSLRAEFIRLEITLVTEATMCWRVQQHGRDCTAVGLYGSTAACSGCQRLLSIRERLVELDKLQPYLPQGIDIANHSTRKGFINEILVKEEIWLQHGPALVRTQPLERVNLLEKRPMPPTHCTWWRKSHFPSSDPKSNIADEIFECFFPTPIFHIEFHSPRAADDALSQACLRWAKEQKT